MNDKEFKDAVYRKYNAYLQDQNTCDFLKQSPRKKTSSVLTTILLTLLLLILAAGAALAAAHYAGVWKEPVPYNYDEEKVVTEEKIEQSLGEDQIRKIAKETLAHLMGSAEEITGCTLGNDPTTDSTFWEITTAGENYLRLNGKSGKLMHFSVGDMSRSFKETDRPTAEQTAQKIYSALWKEKGHTLTALASQGDGQWTADFCRIYNGIANPYQCVRLWFAPSKKEVLLVSVFDDPFENNPYAIPQEQAISIAAQSYGAQNIKAITAQKAIEKMNALLYQKEHEGQYRTEQIVRNVWKVQITDQKTDFKEWYFVDATTGELIGGDALK